MSKDKVEDGELISLSLFAVIAGAVNAHEPIPRTGDTRSNLIWWLLFGTSVAGIVALALINKKRY